MRTNLFEIENLDPVMYFCFYIIFLSFVFESVIFVNCIYSLVATVFTIKTCPKVDKDLCYEKSVACDNTPFVITTWEGLKATSFYLYWGV